MRLACLLLFVALPVMHAGKKPRTAKEWSRVSEETFNSVEGSWQVGDDPDELLTEDEVLIREMDRRRHEAPFLDPEQFQ